MLPSLRGNQLFIKRDDLYPLCFGGNKARKARLFFKDIQKTNADYVVTYGSGSSNHCRAVANMAAMHGLSCLIVTPEETDKLTNNKRLAAMFGAEYIYCPVDRVAQTIEATLERLKNQGHTPYFIPGGGHGNLGTQAYVEAYEEILTWERQRNCHFDYIFFASGTGTTHAGLVCGKLLHGVKGQKIVGISIARKNPRGRQVVLDSMTDYLGHASFPEEEVEFLDDHICGGYGKYCGGIVETIRRQMIQNSIPLDVTYTGKAFWGMEQYLSSHEITGKNVLFIHTGGTPLFFDDLEQII